MNPLIYLPGNFVPVNSKYTRILYEIFPSLALPTTVTSRVCDIWRGYIMQRYGWIYGGSVVYVKSNIYYKGDPYNTTSMFEEEKALFLEIDNLLESLNSTISQEIQHPQIFLIKLIEILVKKNLLGKNDLEMYKAFIIDLESIGYNCTKKYQINTKYNFRNYLNISTELQYYLPPNDNIIINKGYNCKFKIYKNFI